MRVVVHDNNCGRVVKGVREDMALARDPNGVLPNRVSM